MMNNTAQALKILGDQIVQKMRSTLQSNNVDASGRLSKSISSNVVETGEDYKLQISMEDYGEIVDKGRGRSRTGGPKQTWRPKIINWMKDKGITPRAGVSLETAAFLITRKINERGYKAKPFIQSSVDYIVKQDLQGVLGKAAAKDIEIQLSKK